MSNWKSKLVLSEGDTLEETNYRPRGTLAQNETWEYRICNGKGETVGTVEHEHNTNLKSLRNTEHLTQYDINGKIVVKETWSS